MVRSGLRNLGFSAVLQGHLQSCALVGAVRAALSRPPRGHRETEAQQEGRWEEAQRRGATDRFTDYFVLPFSRFPLPVYHFWS